MVGPRGDEWFALLQQLPDERFIVAHEPPTPRYGRALAKVPYLLAHSRFLGQRATESGAIEIAAWAPPPSGRGHGYYTCTRVWIDEEHRPSVAVLFCFYDGTEQSPGFKSLSAASVFARSQGFEELDDYDTH